MLRLFVYLIFIPAFCCANELVVATDVWEDYSSPDGSGLYEELLQKVYQESFELRFIYTDYTRSKALVKSGKADLWLCAYKDEETFAITPTQSMDMDFVHAIYLENTQPQYHNASAAWLATYYYDRYFPEYDLQGHEVRDMATAFRLLSAGKVQFILGDETEMIERMEREKIRNDGLIWAKFGDLPLYPAFAINTRTNGLIEQWNEKMALMKSSGELAELFKKHDLFHEYPF